MNVSRNAEGDTFGLCTTSLKVLNVTLPQQLSYKQSTSNHKLNDSLPPALEMKAKKKRNTGKVEWLITS